MNRCRGAATVEFAVVAPLLILLTFGMVDIGRVLMVENLLTNAARDAARSAVLEGADAATVRTEAVAYLSESGVNGAVATVNPDPLTAADQGDPVTVNIQVPVDAVSWLPTSMFLSGQTLEATVVMRREVTTDTGGAEE